MAAAIALRADYESTQLRDLARQSVDADQVRRLPALALVLSPSYFFVLTPPLPPSTSSLSPSPPPPPLPPLPPPLLALSPLPFPPPPPPPPP